MAQPKDSFSTRKAFSFKGQELNYHSLPTLAEKKGVDLSRLPLSLLVLLENLLRHEDGDVVHSRDVDAVLSWSPKKSSTHEIQFTPARVLLQDFTGVPVVADLAAMRSALAERGGNPSRVNPLQPVDLVIDHSVQVDAFGTPDAFIINNRLDFERNRERYEFLKWGQSAFDNFNVVPPATGICHQVNLEYLSHVAMRSRRPSENVTWVHPDTLVGTDSHTPMVNGLGVLGWGVGGIEAEAAMLGQPCSMLIPDVVGFELSGELRAGVTATDLVLTITQILRKKGVVGKFVEFTGRGVRALSIANRATISNMAPEYGATVGFWPIDSLTVDYLRLTGRAERAELTEQYYRLQNMWLEDSTPSRQYSDLVHLDLSQVETSLAGPAKPHDRVPLAQTKSSFSSFLKEQEAARGPSLNPTPADSIGSTKLRDGSIVIAAITSCTNTSNPSLMLGAALLAKKAVERGLKVAPWVKTSFAPGSTAVTDFIQNAGLMSSLEKLGFNLVGYGCTTCIGNSGPLPETIANQIESRRLTVAAVLSGNRNFEARIHPQVRANYLASPPLVVAFALAGRIDIDLSQEPLGTDSNGHSVYLRDIWPDSGEITPLLSKHVTPEAFAKSYADVFKGDEEWRKLPVSGGASYAWSDQSTYIKRPPFLNSEFTDMAKGGVKQKSIDQARILAVFGDFITTDHISPAGSIGSQTPAGLYLSGLGVRREDFNSYGSRRGNHEVMMRGTFANVRLRNRLVQREGGFTKHWPDGEEMSIFTAALKYQSTQTPLVIFAGREYGSGSSRDWAAKGTRLLGVRAVIAETYERIHRSNLVGMGVLPLEFIGEWSVDKLHLKGDELVSIEGLDTLQAKSRLTLRIEKGNGSELRIEVLCRIDTPNELRYYEAGGILPYVLSRLSSE